MPPHLGLLKMLDIGKVRHDRLPAIVEPLTLGFVPALPHHGLCALRDITRPSRERLGVFVSLEMQAQIGPGIALQLYQNGFS